MLKEEERELYWEEDEYTPEKYHRFECAYNDLDMEAEYFDKIGKYYRSTLEYIRSEIPKKKLQKISQEHLKHTRSEIKEVTSLEGWGKRDSDLNTIIKKYKKEYEEKGYAKRLDKFQK